MGHNGTNVYLLSVRKHATSPTGPYAPKASSAPEAAQPQAAMLHQLRRVHHSGSVAQPQAALSLGGAVATRSCSTGSIAGH